MNGQFMNPTNPPVLQRRSVVIPVAITLACAVLLTGGFVFGAFATCNFMASNRSKWFPFFFWGSVTGLAVVLLCVLFLIVWGIWRIAKRIREN